MSEKLSARAFVLLGVPCVLALYGVGAYFDRSLLDPSIEDQVEEVQRTQTDDFERGFAQGRHVSGAQIKTAYQQGLEEGAAGMFKAFQGVSDLQVAQACLAVGFKPLTAKEWAREEAPR